MTKMNPFTFQRTGEGRREGESKRTGARTSSPGATASRTYQSKRTTVREVAKHQSPLPSSSAVVGACSKSGRSGTTPSRVQKKMASPQPEFFAQTSGAPRRSRYNTGRWMKEEHEAFLRGVELYQKDWHLIATVVKTRSVLQIRTHGQKYFNKLAKGEVFPLEPYRSMYDAKPSSPSLASTVPPPPPFVHGGEVMRHQLNDSASNTSPWMGNVSFNGSGGSGGGGDFPRAQVLRYHYQHPQLLAGEQQHQHQHQHQTMVPFAGSAGSTGSEDASSTMLLPPMTPASAAGAFAQSQSPGSSSSFASSSSPSPAASWGATSSMDTSHRSSENMGGHPVDPAAMSSFTAASLPPFGGNGGFLATTGYPGAAAPGWPGGGVPGGTPEGARESGVGDRVDGRSFYQYRVKQQHQQHQQQQQQQQQQRQLEGWEDQTGHHAPPLPEGLGPLEGWLSSPLLQGEEAGTEDPDGDLALDFVRDFDSLGAL